MVGLDLAVLEEMEARIAGDAVLAAELGAGKTLLISTASFCCWLEGVAGTVLCSSQLTRATATLLWRAVPTASLWKEQRSTEVRCILETAYQVEVSFWQCPLRVRQMRKIRRAETESRTTKGHRT